jgi:hypothetical protein
MNNQHISLDYEDFKCLVRGGILTAGDIKICLKDIGFDMMYEAMESAEKGIDIYKEHNKE